jgi:MYXO-CTERM domain-containing protein
VMRPPGAMAVPLTVLLVLAGTGVAFADVRLYVTESEAGPGDIVQFSISGTESRATYALEIDDREIAQGSVPADESVSGEFTMPDLGDASRTVTLEAQIEHSEETTTVTRRLQYVARSRAVTGPAGTVPSPVPEPAAAVQRAPVAGSGPRSPARKHRDPRRPAAKRRAPRAPPSAGERRWHARRSTAGTERPSRVSTPRVLANTPHVAPRPDEKGKHASTPRSSSARSESAGRFTVNSIVPPATSSPGSGVAGSDKGGRIAAVAIFALLGLAMLALVRRPRTWRPAAAQGPNADDDDEVLQGVVHVPRV